MSFFSASPHGLILEEYDILHLSAILFFAAAIILSIVFRKRIRNARHENIFRYTITIIAIIFEVVFKIWDVRVHNGTLLSDYLPLDLCAITLYLCWFLNFTKAQWIFKLVYFYSIGALVSLFVPELGGFGPNHFRYYHYFYVHGYIVFTAIYFTVVHGYKITFRDFLRATGILIVLAGFVMLVDYLCDANYMYLMHKPEAGSPLDLFGSWPDYLAGLIGISLGTFVLAYLPWFFINRKAKKQQTIEN